MPPAGRDTALAVERNLDEWSSKSQLNRTGFVGGLIPREDQAPWPDQASTFPELRERAVRMVFITPPAIPRSGRRYDRSARSRDVALRRYVAGCAKPSAMTASGRA